MFNLLLNYDIQLKIIYINSIIINYSIIILYKLFQIIL